MRNRKEDPAKEVADWNARVKVGDTVEYVEVRNDPSFPPTRYTTACEAEVLSGHTAVVWLNGKRGCVAVSHCTPVAEMTMNGTFDFYGDQGIEFGHPLSEDFAIGWRFRRGGHWWVDTGASVSKFVQDDFGNLVRP